MCGAARPGRALLAGLLRCGHCMRRMQVRDNGRSAGYQCRGARDGNAGDCLRFGAAWADAAVGTAVLEALQPLGVEAALQAWGATWRSQWREGLGATGDAKERPCSEHRVGKPLVGLDAGPERSGTAVPEGCRHNRSEEPDALAGPSGSGRGPSGNRRATATGRRRSCRRRRCSATSRSGSWRILGKSAACVRRTTWGGPCWRWL